MATERIDVLALADFSGMDEAAIRTKIEEDFSCHGALNGANLIVAYMSEGSFGCDSDAFIVFERYGKLYEVHGSHCSCYGFEGQWDPEEVSDVAVILSRKDGALAGGGYDRDQKSNAAAIRGALARIGGVA